MYSGDELRCESDLVIEAACGSRTSRRLRLASLANGQAKEMGVRLERQFPAEVCIVDLCRAVQRSITASIN